MATPDFFDENLNRTFPFRRGSAGVGTPDTGAFTLRQLPDWAIVDCGFVMGPESGFVEGTHQVYLSRISNVDDNLFEFEFVCDAPAIADKTLVFTRSISDPKFSSEFVESDFSDSEFESVSYSFSDDDCGEPFWSGYLTTGSLVKLVGRIPTDTSVTRVSELETIVEPCLIQNLDGSQLIAINVANADRTRSIRPAGCEANSWDFPPNEIYLSRTCIQGDVRFRLGYNSAITLVPSQNVIRFSAIRGAGQGEPCEQVKLFAGETPPVGANNNLLDGDFYCNEVFRTVNGLPGPDIRIIAGPGVRLSTDESTIVIDVNLSDLPACDFQSESESEE